MLVESVIAERRESESESVLVLVFVLLPAAGGWAVGLWQPSRTLFHLQRRSGECFGRSSYG